MRTATLFLLVSCVAACGSSDSGDCAEGLVLANPDGRGERCVGASSECLTPDACPNTDPCCNTSCQDPEGDAVFACVGECRAPDCEPTTDCGLNLHCEVYDECSAACAPELDCAEGEVIADPDGAGFRCIPGDSTCFRPEDCFASTDQCCDNLCVADASGHFACGLVCEDDASGNAGDGAGDRDEGAAEPIAPECYRDAECAQQYGEGWNCQGCPGLCIGPPVECTTAADCVLATKWDVCCPVANAYTQAEVDADRCVTTPDETPPSDCIMACGAKCPDVVAPTSVDCQSGECVGVY